MALSADRNTPVKDGVLIPVPVAASTSIKAGALVCANATGFAVNGAVATTLTYLGRAEEAVDNSAGADGAKTILVRRKAAFKWENHGTDTITQALLGKTCYVVDDQTVAATAATSTRSAAGKVIGVESDGVWVE